MITPIGQPNDPRNPGAKNWCSVSHVSGEFLVENLYSKPPTHNYYIYMYIQSIHEKSMFQCNSAKMFYVKNVLVGNISYIIYTNTYTWKCVLKYMYQ